MSAAIKTAMVTGGMRGIGLGIVKALSRGGYQISVFGRSPYERVEQRIKELQNDGVKIVSYTAGNIAVAGDLERYMSNTLSCCERVELLVNNAGMAPVQRVDILEMTAESFDEVISVNLKGTLMLSQIAAKHMIAAQRHGEPSGIIINISSVSAYTSSVTRGEYCISKAGISMLTKLLADRLADEGILVYEIRPGIIETDMTGGVRQKYDALIADGLLPIKRWGTPDDVGEAVKVLAEGRLAYSTGQVINVDGGFHIRRL